MTKITVPAKPAITIEEAVPEHTIVETYKNTTPENYAYFDAEVEAIHMILSGIRDDIYSIVDACLFHSFMQLNKGKEVAKPITPSSELASKEEDSDPKQAQRDKDMQKNLALIAKYIKNIYKPINKNLRTSSNTKNKNVDTSLRHMSDNQTRQFGNQRTVFGARETVGNQVQSNDVYNVFATERQHFVRPETINDTYVVETVDSNVITNSLYMCDNEKHANQNANEYKDEHVVLANLIEIELEKYKKYKNYQLEKEEVERKLKDTLGLLAQQKFQSDEALKTQAFETFQFKEKNIELVHLSSLEHTRYDLLQKENKQLKKDFKIRQDKDIEKLIALEHQVKFLKDVVYKRNQSIQTIHMLAPNPSLSYNGRLSFVNPKYVKKAQSEKPCLYKVPYDKYDLANIFAPNCEETLILEQESRSKLHKETIKKYDYTYQNSLYENFKPQTRESLNQLYYANEARKKMWRKSFVKYKPNIVNNIGFLPTQASLSKSRYAFNVVQHNITNFKTVVDLD
ncbi:hypothetical protein Tco_1335176 [Tanacetum coccineum]